ncbi:MAG: OsmC family protein [Gudongella sp.]|nr:OsmC family protein [Gudongella sp.]
MSKEKGNKKSSLFKKISIGFGAILGIAIVGASVYWFSMPSETRNMIGFWAFAGKDYDNYIEYQVIERNDQELQPSGMEFVAAESEAQDNNVNIGTANEMVKNNTSSMMKKGRVQTIGIDGYTGWQVLADEGAAEGSYPYGPSPLSYYTAGEATNLHTQIIMAAELEGVELDHIAVEVLNEFRWYDMMASDGNGNLELSTVNIIIESDASEEVIQRIKETAINAWSAGNALKNKTEVIPNLIINGDNWEIYNAKPGTSKSEVSYDGDIKLSSVTDVPKMPEYLEFAIEETDDSILNMLESMSNLHFEIYAISESVENSDRPYFKKVTLSTPSGETWELYSDEFMGENDIPLAPTSLEYFTVGTSLCLTSQTTLVSAMMGLDYTDYRVEHLFEYRQEDVNTTEMIGALDVVNTFVFIESDESKETLETFFRKSLALCFAGEGLVNETEMDISIYLNGDELN